MSCTHQLLHGDDGGPGLVAFDIVFEFLAELLHESESWHRCCIAERAEGAAHHVLGEVLNVIDVLLVAAAVVDTGQGLLDPVRTLAAGDTPATRLMLIEGDGAKRELYDGHTLIEDDDPARPKHGPGLGHLVEVEAHINLLCGQNRARSSSGNNCLQLLAILNAARYLIDSLAKAIAHRQFVNAGALYMTTDAEETCSTIALGAELRNRLGVVDDGWSAIEADDSREGRLDARNTAFAFERLH